MNDKLNQLITEARKLPLVPLEATSYYQQRMTELTDYVDRTLSADPQIQSLIGDNSLQMLHDNHRNHAAFMTVIFSIGNYELLGRTLPWVYRAYSSHRFSYDYFPRALDTWTDAVNQLMAPDMRREIIEIYRWMQSSHDQLVAISRMPPDAPPPLASNWLETKDAFLFGLLEGDQHQCMDIATTAIKDGHDIGPFYLQIVQPSLYEIGMMWERGQIGVAEEHLASAIVSRIMASIGARPTARPANGRRVLVTATANELHEIGAWMVSDLLEQDGWTVRYLGANTPTDDLLNMMHGFRPDFLALSVTMSFNLLKIIDTIRAVRDDTALADTRIMVGGRPFNEIPGLWKQTGATGFAANAEDARLLANEWWQNE